MTARSDRRNAELAVIEAARYIRGVTATLGMLYTTGLGITRLNEAIDALDAVPLPDASAARSSRGAPLTSQNAAAYARGGRASSLSARIVRQLDHPRVLSIGMTVEELCGMLGRKHQSVSARIHDLKETGWIVGDADYTRTTSSGSEAIVWRLSQKAREELAVARAEHRERII